MLMITVAAGTIALTAPSKDALRVEHVPHSTFGIITMILVIILGILGLITLILQSNCINMNWRTPHMILFKNLHKYLGYFLIVGSQVTLSLGLWTYYKDVVKEEDGKILIGAANLLFFSFLITSEVIYRLWNNAEVNFEVNLHLENISKAEFADRVYNQGRALVILDEYVLDVSEFMHKHPGGKFALK